LATALLARGRRRERRGGSRRWGRRAGCRGWGRRGGSCTEPWDQRGAQDVKRCAGQSL